MNNYEWSGEIQSKIDRNRRMNKHAKKNVNGARLTFNYKTLLITRYEIGCRNDVQRINISVVAYILLYNEH